MKMTDHHNNHVRATHRILFGEQKHVLRKNHERILVVALVQDRTGDDPMKIVPGAHARKDAWIVGVVKAAMMKMNILPPKIVAPVETANNLIK